MGRSDDDTPIGTSPRVRDQPSLTTASGKSWLILGGLLALIAIGVMVPLLPLSPSGVALGGICAIVACYAAMVIVRVNAQPGRGMLILLAIFMSAIAIIGVGCVGIIAATQGGVFPF